MSEYKIEGHRDGEKPLVIVTTDRGRMRRYVQGMGIDPRVTRVTVTVGNKVYEADQLGEIP